MSKANQNGVVKVTLKKSMNGRLSAHRSCVRGLGLRKIGQTVEVLSTPDNWGMINKVQYLLDVEGERPCK